MTTPEASTDCPSCAAALGDPASGLYHAGCRECEARALSRSPGFHASMAALRFRNDYADALRRIAGPAAADRDALHRRVRWWADRLAERAT